MHVQPPMQRLTWDSRALARSVRQADNRQPYVRIELGLPDEPGWTPCAELLDPSDGFTRWRTLLTDWLLRRYDAAPPQTVAGFLASWYLYAPAFAGALLLHHERRVPALEPANLAIQLGNEPPSPIGIALLSERFHCLPSDPDAGSDAATVVADEGALAAALRVGYIAHASAFIRAFGPSSPLGRHTLWGAATDALDNALWLAGMAGGNAAAESDGVADAALVLADRFAPLTSATTLRMTENREWTRRRESCCFNYKLPGEAECGTCPRICPR